MASVLREPVGPEQQALLQVIGEPFNATGNWPVWQYVDLTLEDEHGLDAGTVLASLPEAGDKSPTSLGYGLIWRMDSYRQPNPDDRVALTVAGLRFLPQAESVTGAFAAVVGYMASQQAQLVPSPEEVVTATVTSAQLAERLRKAGYLAEDGSQDSGMLDRIRALLEHEPFLFAAAHQPGPSEPWTVKVPAVLRRYRDVTSVEDYIDTVTSLVASPDPPSVPPSVSALDIPYAIGYLDAVWQARTGRHLFVSLDPASVARLTLACGSEEEFNSLMSALADVLGQTAVPGTAVPPQRGALEAVRDYLAAALAPEAADRVSAAFETLIRLRRIRVSTQHADARHRAVTSFAEIGLAFPPPSWGKHGHTLPRSPPAHWTPYGKKRTPASHGSQATEAACRYAPPTGPTPDSLPGKARNRVIGPGRAELATAVGDGARCNGPRTRPGPPAGAAHRRSASGR